MTKVLIVDDIESNLFALENVLKDLDVEIVKASSGDDALRATLGHDFALAILDVQMPEMDGYELASLLRSDHRTKNIPIIFLSAVYSEVSYVFKGYESGAVDFITKPFSSEVLLSKVSVFLELAEQRAELERKGQRLQILVSQLEEQVEARKATEALVCRANDELEERVRGRTIELSNAVERLELLNRELREFAYIASHDLQEPLRKIQVFGDRLRSRCAGKLDEAEKDYLVRMENAANRMQELIRDLLKYSRVATRPKPYMEVDLNEILREVVEIFEYRLRKLGGRIDVAELPLIEADPTQMKQLFQNLIGNALKFQKEGEIPVVQVHGNCNGEDGNLCRIFIEDNGIGFDLQYSSKIFAPFQRLHNRSEYEGTGMGLAICRKITERHGGGIEVESKPGSGTTFIIALPRKQYRGGPKQ